MFNKKSQSGRSMVEMLGVLAIIGVLSIGGIAGYTLIFNSRNLRIVSHQPFEGRQKAIHHNHDIANESRVFEKLDIRMKVSMTDQGRELSDRVEDLLMLLEAYRSGAVTEDHKN